MATGFFNRVANALRDKLTPSAPLIGGPDQNPVKPEDRGLLNKIIGDRIAYPRFSPQSMEEVSKEYLGYLPSIGLGTKAKLATDAVDKFVANRVDDILKLKEAKTPDGALIHEKLSANDADKKDAIKAVKQELNKILDGKALEEGVQKEYKESIAAFQQLLAGPKKFHVQEVQGLLEEITNNTRTAIEAQQKNEIDQLETLFKNEAFQAHLTTALALPDDKEEKAKALNAVKESMRKDLENAHEKQLKEFNNEIDNTKITLHKAAEQQLKAFLFMADLNKNDPKMQAMIERLAEENRATATNVSVDISEDRADISCVNLDQLTFIQRLGGGKIETHKDKEGKLSYTLDMGMKFTNPRYYFNDHHKKDMETMAQAIRASGAQSITMSLNFENEKIAQERGRQAFEACLRSGFPPEEIDIKVNGVLYTYKPEEKEGKPVNQAISSLYYDDKDQDKSKKAKYETVVHQSTKTRADLDEIIKKGVEKKLNDSPGDLESIKGELQDLKRKAREVEVGVNPISEHDDTRTLSQ
ncbi:hypothetical protein [Legionella rowbothamii]|uniref:hypothetical protein n=1 Tax=Legionella rowbothamii TaxID=96229 RepID=UPI0010563764|nr:hypothetical protein [Legionella rowbothamii]